MYKLLVCILYKFSYPLKILGCNVFIYIYMCTKYRIAGKGCRIHYAIFNTGQKYHGEFGENFLLYDMYL